MSRAPGIWTALPEPPVTCGEDSKRTIKAHELGSCSSAWSCAASGGSIPSWRRQHAMADDSTAPLGEALQFLDAALQLHLSRLGPCGPHPSHAENSAQDGTSPRRRRFSRQRESWGSLSVDSQAALHASAPRFGRWWPQSWCRSPPWAWSRRTLTLQKARGLPVLKAASKAPLRGLPGGSPAAGRPFKQ